MSDLDDFLKMELKNCAVKRVNLFVGKTCSLSLLHGPISLDDQDVIEELGIEFRELIAVITELRMEPWLEVLNHELLGQSSYLQGKDFRENGKPDPFHFRFRCDEGTLDIIARQFSFVSREHTRFIPSDQIVYEELSCSFCGRKQSEVQKIVAGPGVFICDDCTRSCYEVIFANDQDK
jgi:ClpX C4-type zinc finger